jgi:hypothetical protein
VAGEAGEWARQLGLLAARLSAAAAADPGVPAVTAQRLAEGCRSLVAASAALTPYATGGAGPGAGLLAAVPVHDLPQRPVPGDGETAGELAGGIAVTAARLRVIAPAAAGQVSWSAALTADSWRWTATGAAVICHVSEILLTTLADRAGLAGSAEAAGLAGAGEAAALACVRWREVTAAWTDMTTGLGGLRAPGIADTGDLVIRLGRLAFADPGWTPVRSRGAPVRAANELAPDGRQAAVVAGAVHHAAEALACVAAADLRAVRTVVRAGRIYVPTRTLPDRVDVPHRFWSPAPARVAALTEVYQAAAAAAGRLVSELDLVAVTMDTPSRIRAEARAAVRRAPDVSDGWLAASRAGRAPVRGDVDRPASRPLQWCLSLRHGYPCGSTAVGRCMGARVVRA